MVHQLRQHPVPGQILRLVRLQWRAKLDAARLPLDVSTSEGLDPVFVPLHSASKNNFTVYRRPGGKDRVMRIWKHMNNRPRATDRTVVDNVRLSFADVKRVVVPHHVVVSTDTNDCDNDKSSPHPTRNLAVQKVFKRKALHAVLDAWGAVHHTTTMQCLQVLKKKKKLNFTFDILLVVRSLLFDEKIIRISTQRIADP